MTNNEGASAREAAPAIELTIKKRGATGDLVDASGKALTTERYQDFFILKSASGKRVLIGRNGTRCRFLRVNEDGRIWGNLEFNGTVYFDGDKLKGSFNGTVHSFDDDFSPHRIQYLPDNVSIRNLKEVTTTAYRRTGS